MKTFLGIGWAASLGLGLLALGVFVQGLVRDHHAGDPEIGLRLDSASDWSGAEFRVWGEKPYALYLASVNHDPPFEVPYRGAVEVRLVSPSGRESFHRVYAGQRLDHVRPDNTSWSHLASLRLEDRPWRSWRLEARVVEPDPSFAGVSSYLHLRRVRPDVGMGGLINYAMIFPAAFLLLLSLALALALARRGAGYVPTVVSGLAVIALALVLS